MNYVILTGNYYPNPSPNGNIADILIKELIKENHKVDVICFDRGEFTTEMDEELLTIHKLSVPHRDLLNSAKLKKNKVLKNTIRLYRALKSFIYNENLESWYYLKALKELNDINKIEKIDKIVSLNNPIEAHLAAIEFKRTNNCKVICYWLDQYADVKELHKYKRKKDSVFQESLKIEKIIHKEADLNLIPFTRAKWIEEHHFSGTVKVVHFPLVNHEPIIEGNKLSFNKSYINITYAGTFYKNLRNPEQLLLFFSNLDLKRIKFNLFWRGDCEDLIIKYKNNSNIVDYGEVNKYLAAQAINESDILINLGNKNDTQLPSKLYDYINLGKPILNIYYNNSFSEVLDGYPLCLSVKYEEIHGKSEEISNFIKVNARNKLTKEKILELYYDATPRYLREIVNEV